MANNRGDSDMASSVGKAAPATGGDEVVVTGSRPGAREKVTRGAATVSAEGSLALGIEEAPAG